MARGIGAARGTRERTAGFAISVWGEDVIAGEALELGPDNAFVGEGYMTAQGKITGKGWDRLTVDTQRLERNALKWLEKNFVSATDQGHDRHGDLLGNVVWDPGDKKQSELIELGENDRIDAVDRSYSDFANMAFDGCSSFARAVLGGQINFFDTGLGDE